MLREKQLKETLRRAKDMVDQHEENAEIKWRSRVNEERNSSKRLKSLVLSLQSKLALCISVLEKVLKRSKEPYAKAEVERLLEELYDAHQRPSGTETKPPPAKVKGAS